MAKYSVKIQNRFKMADILLGLGHGTKRLSCRVRHDTRAHLILYIKVKRTARATLLKY